jgi:hypothetical protein
MTKKGAPQGNANAEKKQKGKPMSLYLPADVLPAIAKQLEEEGKDTSETECLKRAKEYALDGIREGLNPTPEREKLYYLVASWQALSNHAEVMAPELLDNPTWKAFKAFSLQRNDEVGVTAFMEKVSDRRREQFEREDEDEEEQETE